MKKKILIVSRSFYPENSPRSNRTTELSKEFARQGHEVTVLTPRNESVHAVFEKEHHVKIKNLGTPRWKSPDFGKSKLGYFLTRATYRFLSLAFEYPAIELLFLVKKALQKEKGYDLLISIAVPYSVHWGVATIWKKNNTNNPAKHWIADCGDPYMGQENDSFKAPFYFAWVEKWFCRKVDYLTVPTANSIKGYYPEFHNKIKVIPQGFRFEDYKFNSAKNPQKDTIVFGYGGMFIPGRRDPKELLKFLVSIEKDHNFEFHIFTTTPQWVLPYIKDSKSIKLFDPIERMELMQKFSEMDFLINFTNIGTAQTPSKLIDYAILNKPILIVETGNLNKEVVIEFLRGNYGNKFFIDSPDQYRIENICQQFLKLR